jgi:undecaprenyl-diphosphatase
MIWLLYISAIFLGLVQGLTEFIPVSSSGHLILASIWIDFESYIGGPEKVVVFEVVIQFGSVFAILAQYGRELLRTANDLIPTRAAASSDQPRSRLGPALIVGTLPVLIVGFLAGGYIQDNLYSPVVVAWGFIIGGVIMWIVECLPLRPACVSTHAITLRQALLVGLFQVLALIPGTSRSGATIIGALGIGLDRRTATEFSFLLALPVLVAATGYTVLRNASSFDAAFILPLAIGFVVSFLSSWLVIRWLLRFVRSHSFKGFALYRIAFGIVLLLAIR